MKKHAIGLVIAGLTLVLGGGLALALDDPPDPEIKDDQVTTVVDSSEDEGTGVETQETEVDETEVDEIETDDVEATDAEHPENHGKYVSQAAQEDCADAENHGQCVSEVARSEAGKPMHDEASTGDEEESGEETPAVVTASAGHANSHARGHGKSGR